MSISKIITQHTQSVPGWCVSNQSPTNWIKKELQPLVSEYNVEIKHNKYHNTNDPANIEKTRFICQVGVGDKIMVIPEYNNKKKQSSKQVELGLFWIRDANYVAISSQILDFYSYRLVKTPNQMCYIKEPDQLKYILSDISAYTKKLNFEQSKVNKIRSIKQNAIIAQIAKIAKEEGFCYFISSTKLLIKIDILFGRNKYLELSFPYGEFENILPQLRESIIRLRSIHENKIGFKIMQTSSRPIPWIKPDIVLPPINQT